MKKNILFVSPTGTLDNGAEISITNLMSYLVNDGHKVYNAFPNVDLTKQQDYINFCKKNNIEYFPINILKWWWYEAPGGTPGTQQQLDYMYRENISEIRNIIVKNKIDVVITNTVNMFQGAIAASCERVPHIWLIHEFPFGEFGYYQEKIPFITNFSESIFAVSGALTKDLQERLPQRRIKSFSPFTSVKEYSVKKGEKIRIVCVGRLTPRKNQLELLKAYSFLENLTNYELLFIGGWDERYKSECDQFIEKNHLTNVTFTGNVDNPWSLLTDRDICVLPAEMETFGLVYVEAVLNAIPVILSDNAGHLSAFELSKIGKIYPLNHVQELSEKIQTMIQNFDDEKTVAYQGAKIIKENYQIQKVYSDLIEHLESDKLQSNDSLNAISSMFESVGIKESIAVSNGYYRKFLRMKNWFKRFR